MATYIKENNLWPDLGKHVLPTQNALVHIMAPISCSVCAIQNPLAYWITHGFLDDIIWWYIRYNMDYR